MFSNGQILVIASLVNLIPFTAVILPWTRFPKIAGWLLLFSLGIGLLIGTYEHFLSFSPDSRTGIRRSMGQRNSNERQQCSRPSLSSNFQKLPLDVEANPANIVRARNRLTGGGHQALSGH
jgi:hypothetical protein